VDFREHPTKLLLSCRRSGHLTIIIIGIGIGIGGGYMGRALIWSAAARGEGGGREMKRASCHLTPPPSIQFYQFILYSPIPEITNFP